MAKGKQAAAAAQRRYEAAIEHIDRLTNELAEAKRRARDHEAATRRLPQVMAEVKHLRQQIETETYDKVQEASDRLEAVTVERDALAERLAALQERYDSFSEKVRSMYPAGMAGLNHFLSDLHGCEMVDDGAARFSDQQARLRIARARRQVAPRSSEWTGGVKVPDVTDGTPA